MQTYGEAVDVLVTRFTLERFGADIATVDPSVRLLAMGPDATVTGPGGPVPADQIAPEVVFATHDLFADGAPLEAFFTVAVANPAVRWLQSPGAGTDHPVFGLLLDRGVRVTSTDTSAVPIAEFVVRAVLDHLQGASAWRAAQSAKEWRGHEFREVSGSSWLIVGVGAIGSAVALRARAFGAHVVGVRRHPSGDEPVDRVARPDRLVELAGDADVVVLAAPGTAATESLVDATFLAAMRPGSILVNIARGSLVDEVALVAALDRGIPEVAVLDVTREEPLPACHPFWSHPRVVLTPHDAASGHGRVGRLAQLFRANLARYLAGEPLLHEVASPDR